MHRLEVIRFHEDRFQTLSKFVVIDNYNCELIEGYILELPDNCNQNNISRIPEGEYACVKRNSEKYGDHFHVLDVPNRSYILIHHGNYHTDTRGCLLPGQGLEDINKDGLKDVVKSKSTMKLLNNNLPDVFTLIIKKQDKDENRC